MSHLVRVRAWLEPHPTISGMWRLRTNESKAIHTDWTFDKESLIKSRDYINNEDADDPRYIEVPDEDDYPKPKSQEEINAERAYYFAQEEKRKERKRKEQERIENNRKSKRSNDKYVYVISLIQRGYTVTEYFEGETNLLTMKGTFSTRKVEMAKTFTTKASAQKMVDTLSKNFLVRQVFRNLKVVQKDKKIFTK